MSAAEDTSRHPVLSHASTIGGATARLLVSLVGTKTKTEAEAAPPTEAAIADLIDAALARDPKASLPWAVALTAILITLAGAIGVTFDRVRSLERVNASAAAYDRDMAQWLVISQENDHEALVGLDTMLRKIASATGAQVDHVDAPRESEPPTSVQKRALEAQDQ